MDKVAEILVMMEHITNFFQIMFEQNGMKVTERSNSIAGNSIVFDTGITVSINTKRVNKNDSITVVHCKQGEDVETTSLFMRSEFYHKLNKGDINEWLFNKVKHTVRHMTVLQDD